MSLTGLARFTVLLAIALAPAGVTAQSTGDSGANKPGATRPATAAANPSSSVQQGSASPADTEGVLPSLQPPPRVTVANPPPAPASWPLHEKIAWAANLVLAIVGYAGIMMALSLLKKIERQTAYAESAAETAAASAHAALLSAQAAINAERPWILITVEPSRSMENSFTIMATNRGLTPARITATAERHKIAIDERHLPGMPEYMREEPAPPMVPIILVPGESTAIKPFCRDDIKEFCDSEERFKRIETWEEKVFLYGKVVYMDLISASEDRMHETNWCCWYIHGRQNSGLVLAGPPTYNSHT